MAQIVYLNITSGVLAIVIREPNEVVAQQYSVHRSLTPASLDSVRPTPRALRLAPALNYPDPPPE